MNGQDVRLPGGVSREPEAIALGQRLFFTTATSINFTKSCSSCHLPEHNWVDDGPVSVGVGDRLGVRRAMTIIDAVFKPDNFWDGRAVTVVGQSLQPLVAQAELGNASVRQVMDRLDSSPSFRAEFVKVFGRRPNTPSRDGTFGADFAAAIGAFESTIISGEAPIDRVARGETWALTEAQHRGEAIFFGKGNCSSCHFGHSLSDGEFHNILGATRDRNNRLDRGRGAITNRQQDNFKFATAGLRDVAGRAPFFHAGQAADMAAVVDILDNPPQGSELRRLNLSPDGKADLVKFLIGDGDSPGAFESYVKPISTAPSLPDDFPEQRQANRGQQGNQGQRRRR